MGEFKLTTAQKAAIQSRLPQGLSVENLRLVKCAARVKPLGADDLDPTQRAVFEKATEETQAAGGPALITDGRPTTMAVVAWMAHEGVNRNSQGFIKDELEIASKQISVRHQLIMDWNHSAVRGFSEYPAVIGTWYQGDFAFDQRNNKWGIVTTGLMWAWKFPEIANQMLADQERNGFIEFSMACIASTVDYEYKDGKSTEWLHNPVFFTNSALDVPPADPAATGNGSETPGDGTTEELRRKVMSAMADVQPDALATIVSAFGDCNQITASRGPAPNGFQASQRFFVQFDGPEKKVFVPWNGATGSTGEGINGWWIMPSVVPQTAGVTLPNGTKITITTTGGAPADGTAASKTAANEKEESMTDFEKKIAELEEQLKAAVKRAEEAEGKQAEAEAKAEAAQTELATANASNKTLSDQVSSLASRLKVIEDARTESEQKMRLQTRLAELPKSLREAIQAKPERLEHFTKKVGQMTDDEWKAYKELDLMVAHSTASAATVDYTARSEAEGSVLPTTGAKTDWAKLRQ